MLYFTQSVVTPQWYFLSSALTACRFGDVWHFWLAWKRISRGLFRKTDTIMWEQSPQRATLATMVSKPWQWVWYYQPSSNSYYSACFKSTINLFQNQTGTRRNNKEIKNSCICSLVFAPSQNQSVCERTAEMWLCSPRVNRWRGSGGAEIR